MRRLNDTLQDFGKPKRWQDITYDREKDLVKAILGFYEFDPRVFIWRNNTGGFAVGEGRDKRFIKTGLKGSPDIVGFKRPSGVFLGIECKAAKKKQQPAQEAFQGVCDDGGAVYVLAHSIADVEAVL